MGEEFYCILKLVSGEEVLSLVSVDTTGEEPMVILQNPIVIKVIQNQNGIFMKVKPWIEMANDDIYIMRLDKVITMTETKDKKLIELYNNYNEDDTLNEDVSMMSTEFSSDNYRVKPSSKMGYISSVNEARQRLENLFKNS